MANLPLSWHQISRKVFHDYSVKIANTKPLKEMEDDFNNSSTILIYSIVKLVKSDHQSSFSSRLSWRREIRWVSLTSEYRGWSEYFQRRKRKWKQSKKNFCVIQAPNFFWRLRGFSEGGYLHRFGFRSVLKGKTNLECERIWFYLKLVVLIWLVI